MSDRKNLKKFKDLFTMIERGYYHCESKQVSIVKEKRGWVIYSDLWEGGSSSPQVTLGAAFLVAFIHISLEANNENNG